MPTFIEKVEKLTLPVIPLRGLVAFPSLPLNFELARDISISACNAATTADMYIFLVAQKQIDTENPASDDLYEVGAVAKIRQTLKTAEGTLRVIAEGVCRATAVSYFTKDGHIMADVMSKTVSLDESLGGDVKVEALMKEAMDSLHAIVKFIPSASDELILAAGSIKNPGLMADFIASNVLVRFEDKQKILEAYDPLHRLEVLAVLLDSEAELLRTEAHIHQRVREQIDENQRDYYLREQMKIIQSELGMDTADEVEEYYEKIAKLQLPAEIDEKLRKEVARLNKTQFGSPEATVLRTYLDTCLEIPWVTSSRDRLDVVSAKKILDADHDGLEKVKDRILEYLAVRQLSPNLKSQILCFVGPPGIGKTSLGASIARAMNRRYVRISLGGIRDEADIRGHRKTYIGAMPGRIVTALTQAGTRNPLILLDEIDKMCADAHGDPSSAMLEVLDPEQNKAFRDHFVEMPIDLSDCLFIATANTLDTVPRPLIDRMEIVELTTYTRNEKLAIAKNHLMPKQYKRHGLNRRVLRIADEALIEIIDGYTRESGVRNLERKIAAVCRKAARRIVEEKVKSVTVRKEDVPAFLGPKKLLPDRIFDEDPIGVVNGLAYTESGGDLLRIETVIMDGTGKIELTGCLGDVMKESAHLAVSYIRAHAAELGVQSDFYKTKDIHIHVPEGAVPKDGPSAGVSILTSVASALTGRPVHRDVAMTGELTLTGRVLAIGGLKEKTTAAWSAGVTKVLIPHDNEADLAEIDPIVRDGLLFIPAKTAEEVLRVALCADTASIMKAPAARFDEKTSKKEALTIPSPKDHRIPTTII
ncbi:MAG: endopeptidase La [Clostridia bacterium]|nr:endopeptidase La [Clostridia bacterium]